MSDPSASTPTEVAGQPVADLSRAPLPTERTLRMRNNIPLQAARFALFNARMMRMVIKGHH